MTACTATCGGTPPEMTVWERGIFYIEQIHVFSKISERNIEAKIQSKDQMEDMGRFWNSGEAKVYKCYSADVRSWPFGGGGGGGGGGVLIAPITSEIKPN